MKRIFVLSFLLFAMLMPMLAVAQGYTRDAVFGPTYPGETIRVTVTLDSVNSYTSRTFSLAKYDAQRWAPQPVYAQKLITSVKGKPYVSAYVDGSFDGTNWFACDTLMTADSSETAAVLQINFSNYKFPNYRIRCAGISYPSGKNRIDTVLDMIWYLYHKD